MSEQNKQHWEKVYADKSPLEVSWYQKQPDLSLRLINNTGADKTCSIIDVGGGASTLVDHLYADGFTHIAVLDLSGKALQHAQQRLGKTAANVEWIVSDITEYASNRSYDIWHDRAVFHFLTKKSDRQKYVRNLKTSLRHDGHLIIAAFAIGGPTRCSGLDIVQYDADKISAELGAEFQLVETLSELHTTPSKKNQAFTYYRFSYPAS